MCAQKEGKGHCGSLAANGPRPENPVRGEGEVVGTASSSRLKQGTWKEFKRKLFSNFQSLILGQFQINFISTSNNLALQTIK